MPAYIPPARRHGGPSVVVEEAQVSDRQQERIWRVKLLLPENIPHLVEACPQHLFEGDDSSTGRKWYSFEIPSQASEWEWEELLRWFSQLAAECPE
eukprot:899083-Pelagomonas_calceolata.AAC.1